MFSKTLDRRWPDPKDQEIFKKWLADFFRFPDAIAWFISMQMIFFKL